MKKFLYIFVTSVIVNCVWGQSPDPNWNATVKVIDEASQPIPNANVEMSWYLSRPDSGAKVSSLTDTNGLCKLSHEANGSIGLGFKANKAGYYSTVKGHDFYAFKNNDPQKWNPTVTLVLKKIDRPIPMYAKAVNLGLPVFDKPIGFDFMAGDWIAPYGKGARTDIFFSGHQSDHTLTVSFPNSGDGIQEFDMPALLQNAKMGQSDLRSSQEAPSDDYQSEFVQTQGPDLNRNYYFRVRTVLDSQGNILSTHYGKIYGDFMQFRYYLNPTPNDQGVEFDQKHNLLGGLQSFEEVKAP